MWKIILGLSTAIFILSACGGDKDPVDASHDRMTYDYSDPNVMDDNEIILPHTTVIVQGEIIGIDEAVSNILLQEYPVRKIKNMNQLLLRKRTSLGSNPRTEKVILYSLMT